MHLSIAAYPPLWGLAGLPVGVGGEPEAWTPHRYCCHLTDLAPECKQTTHKQEIKQLLELVASSGQMLV